MKTMKSLIVEIKKNAFMNMDMDMDMAGHGLLRFEVTRIVR